LSNANACSGTLSHARYRECAASSRTAICSSGVIDRDEDEDEAEAEAEEETAAAEAEADGAISASNETCANGDQR
jgi:hypothetical protein